MMPEISIIVPVYNAEDYLSLCIDSILAQSYTDYELILVNDGSTDKSRNICLEYASKEECIVFIDKENGGVSSARNVGLKESKGKWITFVDSDDVLPLNALSILMNLVSYEKNIDLGIAGYTCCNAQMKLIFSTSEYKEDEYILLRDEGINKLYKSEFWQWFICSKIFKGEIIRQNNLEFNERISFAEDRLFIMRYVCVLKGKIAFTTTPVYVYRNHDKSVQVLASTYFNPQVKTGFEASILMYKEICKTQSTWYNKYLALIDVILSYRTVKRMGTGNKEFIKSIDVMLSDVMPKYLYHLLWLIRWINIKVSSFKSRCFGN